MGSFRYLLFCGLLIVPLFANAESTNRFFVGIDAGYAEVDEQSFKPTTAWQPNLGMQRNSLEFSAGYTYFNDLELGKTPSTYIEVSGYLFTLGKQLFPNNFFGLTPQLGLYDWRVKAILNGHRLGIDEGQSPWFGLSGQMQLTDRTDVHLRLQRFKNVSDSDISLATVGIRWRY